MPNSVPLYVMDPPGIVAVMFAIDWYAGPENSVVCELTTAPPAVTSVVNEAARCDKANR